MNNKEICNPKTEVPSGMFLNDKDCATCLLTCLKDLEKNYTIAMTEASNEKLFKKHSETFKLVAELQRKTYELMFKNGWYILEQAENSKIDQQFCTLNSEYESLNDGEETEE
jgi:spore coat protein CotF